MKYLDFLELHKEEQAQILSNLLEEKGDGLRKFFSVAWAWENTINPNHLDFHGRPYSDNAMRSLNLIKSIVENKDTMNLLEKVNAMTDVDMLSELLFAMTATHAVTLKENVETLNRELNLE